MKTIEYYTHNSQINLYNFRIKQKVGFMKLALFLSLLAVAGATMFTSCSGDFSWNFGENSKWEAPLTFTVPNGSRTAGMCGPTHDEEMIYGLGSDGKKHYYAVGTDVRGPGITIWQSEDMVTWKDVGRVFNEENKPAIFKGRGFDYDFNSVSINEKGEYVFLNTKKNGANNYRVGGFNPFWAACLYYDDASGMYYVYYSCSAFGTRNSFIGCAKSKTVDKGWVDCGPMIHTRTGDGKRFNAIDPVVFSDADGNPQMAYGSFFGGISMISLNPKDPSKLSKPGTHGTTISLRDDYDKLPYDQDGFEGKMTVSLDGKRFTVYGQEGASIVYNPDTKYYYLFTSYDRLAWTYHTRVGRSKNLEGPYVDYNGKPMIYKQSETGSNDVHGTKIIGPYRWGSINTGWGANGHTTLFYSADGDLMFGSNSKDRANGTSFVALRKVLWTDDGWPVVTPCIYAGENIKDSFNVPKKAITANGKYAEWDFIVFSVTDDTTFHRTDVSKTYILNDEGGFSRDVNSNNAVVGGVAWKYYASDKKGKAPSMTVLLPDGTSASGKLSLGWDQDRKQQTVVFSGLTKDGVPVWGQRISTPLFIQE